MNGGGRDRGGIREMQRVEDRYRYSGWNWIFFAGQISVASSSETGERKRQKIVRRGGGAEGKQFLTEEIFPSLPIKHWLTTSGDRYEARCNAGLPRCRSRRILACNSLETRAEEVDEEAQESAPALSRSSGRHGWKKRSTPRRIRGRRAAAFNFLIADEEG